MREQVSIVHRAHAPVYSALHVLEALRLTDAQEVAACGLTQEEVLRSFELTHDAFIVFKGAEPVFIFALAMGLRHTRHLMGLGTDRTREVIPHLTRHLRSITIPWLRQSRVVRVEARLPAENLQNWLWLMSMGGQVECELPGYGANGETMIQLGVDLNQLKDDQ